MSTALGVAPDSNGVGIDPLSHRMIIQSDWQTTGIKGGLEVSGTSGLYYAVAPGVAVCSNAAADGCTQAYWPGGNTENQVSANSGGNPRIDTIAMTANNGSPDNLVHVKAIQGAPAANPVAPALPAGYVAIAYRMVPATMSATSQTSSTGSVDYASPYGGVTGVIGHQKVTKNWTVMEDNQWHEQVDCEFYVPTKRTVTIIWKAVSSVGTNANKADANANMGSYFLQLRMNGVIVNDTLTPVINAYADEIMSFRYDQPAYSICNTVVTKGKHTIAAWVYGNKGWLTYPVQFLQGRSLDVIDMGISDKDPLV